MDGSFDVERGLRTARLPAARHHRSRPARRMRVLGAEQPAIHRRRRGVGAIGARTTESQVHRQLASGLSMPVGFERHRRQHPGRRRPACSPRRPRTCSSGSTTSATASSRRDRRQPRLPRHPARRNGGPNYDDESVADAVAVLAKAGLPQQVMIDASHANSGKDHVRQGRSGGRRSPRWCAAAPDQRW